MAFYLQLAILLMSTILVGLVLAIAIGRYERKLRLARYESRVSLLRPIVLRALSDDIPDVTVLNNFRGTDAKLIEGLAWSLLPKVRGTSRDALVEWLVSRGLVEKARRRTYHPGSVIRARAAQNLGAAGVAYTAPDVSRLLTDRNQEVRIVAARALGKLGNPEAVPSLLASLEGTRRIPTSLVSMAIIHIGPSAIDELIVGLKRRSTWARLVCAELLGVHGAYQATDALINIVDRDMSAQVRIRAAKSLGRIGAPQGVPALITATEPHHVSELRATAAQAMGRIGSEEVYEVLEALTADADGTVAIAATEALSSLGSRGRAALVKMSQLENENGARARDWVSRTELADSQVRHRSRSAGRR